MFICFKGNGCDLTDSIGSYLEDYYNRHAADVAEQIMQGAAYVYRVQALKTQGMEFDARVENFVLKDKRVLA